jgi:hypothetical protein
MEKDQRKQHGGGSGGTSLFARLIQKARGHNVPLRNQRRFRRHIEIIELF